MRYLLLFALVAFAGGCATSEAKTPDDLSIVLSSVTLADDCPSPVPATPPQGFAKPPVQQEKAPVARGSCAKPPCPSPNRSRACEQTSMQLSFAATKGAKATTVVIKRVELLDEKGKVLETLTSRLPTQWDAAKGAYVAWDGALASGATVKTSFQLKSPDWNKLGGRFNAQNRTFQLRVVVTVGGSDRTVEKTAIIPARIEPAVVT